jgi:GGDEF domain-containing protein
LSLSQLVVALGLSAGIIATAIATAAVRRARRALEGHVAEQHELLLGFTALSHVDDRDALAHTICRIATDLARGTGSALFQPGPGHLVALGHQGIHPAPPDPELGVWPELERVLRGGRLQVADPLLVPLTGATGVVAAVSIARPQRLLDPFTLSLLSLFGWAAGTALERHGAIVDAVGRDPITGVADRAHGTAAIASLRTGDAVVVCEVDDVATIRRESGDEAADVVQGHLGLHLRNAIRPGDVVARFGDEGFVVVLREVQGPVEVVVRRVLDTWAVEHPNRRLRVGAAVHHPRSAPLDTAESARAALFAAQRSS